MKILCDGILAHSTWKSDLVKRLGCFDYSVIFCLPKEQAAGCFGSLFHSFSVLGWVAKDVRTVHVAEFLHFVENIRSANLDENISEPEVGDMLSLLPDCL